MSSETIGIIIQARMGSTRLPGKVLKPIAGMPLLGHIVNRLRNLVHPVFPVVATSILNGDDPIMAFCSEIGIECFRGSESNVLERYVQRASGYRMDVVVRLTADNPFTDISELNKLISAFLSVRPDYACTTADLPVGLAAEIFSFKALELSQLNASKPEHFEHVNEYILENPDRFHILRPEISKEKRYPNLRLTVDTIEDYKKACFIAERASVIPVPAEEAIALCMQFA